jgi:hypothetical protein
VLIHEIIRRDRAVCGVANPAEGRRSRKTQPVTVLVHRLLLAESGAFGELNRGQTVFA